MSPRPRKVTNDQLFAATLAVMHRLPPHELTLAAIAREAGVTPAVLVQRFGSKRDLLLALSRQFADGSGKRVATLTRQHASPLGGLRAYADCVADMAGTPAAFVRNLAYLQTDLADPDFRRHLAKHARATRAELRRLLDRAIQAGELTPDTPVARLARTVEVVLSGSMLTWVVYQEGSAVQWVRADLDAVLRPYLAGSR